MMKVEYRWVLAFLSLALENAKEKVRREYIKEKGRVSRDRERQSNVVLIFILFL